jgi:hypothetical protein
MATQNEKNARKTLVVQEVMNKFRASDMFEPYGQDDAEEFQHYLIQRGYLIMAL